MAKRSNSSSSFFGSLSGRRTTVQKKVNWLGQRVTVVKYSDTGKTKTYTRGVGLLDPKITTETRSRSGRVIEQGFRKTSCITGKASEHSKKRDGSGRSVSRRYNEGLFRNKTITNVYNRSGSQVGYGETTRGVITGLVQTRYSGICFSCEGRGTKEFDCKRCCCSGRYKGICVGCGGTGIYKPKEQSCRDCDGTGGYKRLLASVVEAVVYGHPYRPCADAATGKANLSKLVANVAAKAN